MDNTEWKLHNTKWKLYESALIKSIRRGLADDAIYWGLVLYELNKADVVWRRLFIHLSEDIGIANENLPANIYALFHSYEMLSKPGNTSYESPKANKLPLVHAILLMANSLKSRAIDNAIVVHTNNKTVREVPDYCIDYHSPLGRRMGRDVKHFFYEASLILNKSILPDEWLEKAKEILFNEQK